MHDRRIAVDESTRWRISSSSTTVHAFSPSICPASSFPAPSSTPCTTCSITRSIYRRSRHAIATMKLEPGLRAADLAQDRVAGLRPWDRELAGYGLGMPQHRAVHGTERGQPAALQHAGYVRKQPGRGGEQSIHA